MSAFDCTEEMNNKHKTILLVEDEPITAMAEEEMIRLFGYEVITAHNGKKAIEIACTNDAISLILMDIDLGEGIDGPQAAQHILEMRNLPIVFLTSHSESEMVEKVRGITRYGYVIKNSGDFVLQTSIEMAFELFDAHHDLRIQHDLGIALNSTMDLRQGLESVLSVALQFTSVDCGGVYIADSATGSLDLMIHRGLSQEFIAHVSHYDSDSPHIQMARHGIASYGSYADIRPSVDENLLKEGLCATAFIPVTSQGQLIAVMNVASHRADSFPENTRIMLETLASNIGSALMRLHLNAIHLEREEKYRRITENMSDIVSEVDARGIITYISPSHRRIFGKDPKELFGTPVFDGVHPDDRERLLVIYAEAVLAKTDREAEYRYRHRDGDYIWLRTSGHALYDEDGNMTGAIFSSSDITRHKQAEKMAQERLRNIRSLVENTNDAIVMIAQDGTVHYASPAIEGITHCAAEELAGTNILDILHPDDRPGAIDYLTRILQGERGHYDFRVIGKNDTARSVRLYGIIVDTKEKKYGITMIMTDLTGRIKIGESTR